MLRDAVDYTCEVKTAQETAKESGGIIGKLKENSGKIGEFWENSGKIGEFRGNSGETGGKFGGNWEKIGQLCFPDGEAECNECNENKMNRILGHFCAHVG